VHDVRPQLQDPFSRNEPNLTDPRSPDPTNVANPDPHLRHGQEGMRRNRIEIRLIETGWKGLVVLVRCVQLGRGWTETSVDERPSPLRVEATVDKARCCRTPIHSHLPLRLISLQRRPGEKPRHTSMHPTLHRLFGILVPYRNFVSPRTEAGSSITPGVYRMERPELTTSIPNLPRSECIKIWV